MVVNPKLFLWENLYLMLLEIEIIIEIEIENQEKAVRCVKPESPAEYKMTTIHL